jgi:hypothetical protein
VLSCYSSAGLTSLRELALDGNRLTSLAPLAALSGMEVLLAAHNHLSSCEGVQVGSSTRNGRKYATSSLVVLWMSCKQWLVAANFVCRILWTRLHTACAACCKLITAKAVAPGC